MKRLFCLWLPNWPIQRVHAEPFVGTGPESPEPESPEPESPEPESPRPGSPGPESPERAIILWREDPRRGRLVAACCRRARANGVRVRLPVAQAAEMVQRTGSQPRLIPHDFEADDEALRKLAWEIQQNITPIIETETLDEKPWAGFPRHQRESLIGEIGGVTHLFGDEKGLLLATQRLLRQWNLSGRIAIANSQGAAWAMAHFGSDDQSICPGQWLVPPSATQQMIAKLPVESLRIDTSTAETLARLGVERVHQLLQLPKDGLAARLGNRLVQRIEQGLEDREEPLSVEAAPAEDQATLELEYPTSDQKILTDRIDRLMIKIQTGLATRQRGALRVTCRLDLVIPPSLSFDVGLFAPTIDDQHLSSLIAHRLESLHLSSDVKRITITVPLSGPLRTAQQTLFETHGETDASTGHLSGSALSRLVDLLSGRLGRESVVDVRLLDDPLPENAYLATPMAGNRSRKSTAAKRKRSNPHRPPLKPTAEHARDGFPNDGLSDRDRPSQSAHSETYRGESFHSESYRSERHALPSREDALRRPLFLFPQPIPLSVAFTETSFHQSVSTQRLPDRIRFAGVIHTVCRHWGPERIETGWWKGPTVRRDYYRVETDRGCWWWIFRNFAGTGDRSRRTYQWLLHGRFD